MLTSPTGQHVADFLGQGGDSEFVALAERHVRIVIALARSYTRGRGFTDTDAAEDLVAAITTAAARSATNPEQLERFTIGQETNAFTPFLGWSLAELVVLNRYRKRAL